MAEEPPHNPQIQSPSFDEQSREGGSLPSSTGTPFFADVVMDLNEAHDLAETPDAARPRFDPDHLNQQRMDKIALPSLGKSLDTMEEGPAEGVATPQQQEDRPFSRITNFETSSIPQPSSPPRWPRDIPWAVAFCIFVPISVIWPILNWEHHDVPSPLAVHPLSTATLHTLVWAAIATLLLSRAMYRTPGGGDGDDARHVLATGLTLAAPISVLVNLALALVILLACPRARIGAAIPVWYTVRDLYLFRRWRRRSNQSGSGSRQAFFQALAAMVLDILSRSLRRVSFHRVLTILLLVQFGVLLLWRWALLVSLNQSPMIVLVTLVGFKWATGMVARLLSLLACGGVMSWFSQQAQLARDAPTPSLDRSYNEETSEDFGNSNDLNITEAYRTVDASVYQCVAEMEDVLDDDSIEDDDEFMEAPNQREHARRQNSAFPSTVKAFLYAGMTVSFGSVAHCGLLGGIAQFVWSQIRKVEQSQEFFARQRENSEFRGMPIGGADTSLFAKLCVKLNAMAREFVKRHSDLAMCHVAAYHKGYQRAARDVASLIEDSGVEPILHDDISTHMCSCVGGALSGIIVLVTGLLLLHQRKNYDPPITDGAVLTNMIAAFVFSYTLIFTVMEPLRAAIKAVYVSFAQHPECLSRAFPIIYHRLHRLSSANR